MVCWQDSICRGVLSNPYLTAFWCGRGSARVTALAPNGNWLAITLLSGLAFLCLPRQFHVAVVEHGHPASLKTARWLFPLYMVLINLFVDVLYTYLDPRLRLG